MDGRGRFLDNIFIERLWRSLKYEALYLHELRDGTEAGRVIGSWIDFYNEVRPHSSLGGQTPGEAYRKGGGGDVNTIRCDAIHRAEPAQRYLRSWRGCRAPVPSIFPSGASP